MRVLTILIFNLLLLVGCSDKVNLTRLSSGATCSSPVSGVLDTSFGTGGARQFDDPASLNAGDESELIFAMAKDSSGDIFTTGRIEDEAVCVRWMVSITKHNGTTGALDTDFGGGDGIVNFEAGNSSAETGQDIKFLSTGEFVVVGGIDNVAGTLNFLISKWNAAGTVETRATFDGQVSGITGCATGLQRDDEARAVALDSSDNFYVAGYCDDETGGQRGLVVFKTNSNGVLDTTFNTSVGANGFYIYGGEDATDEDAKDILRDSSGNLIVLGSRGLEADTNSDTLLLKLNSANGELDTTWGGGDGIVDDATKGQLWKGVEDSSGRIYAVGRSHNGTNWDMTIWRYTSAGVLDSTWGTGGELDFNLGSNEIARDIKLDDCGNIVVFGYIENSGSGREDAAIWRYTPQGSLDTSFGSGNGYVTNTLETGNNDRAFAGLIDTTNNKYVTGGSLRSDAADTNCNIANTCDMYLTMWE